MKERVIYLIDGVSVPKKIWYRRQRGGEHAAAVFSKQVIKSDKQG